jgi:hypothetical protein
MKDIFLDIGEAGWSLYLSAHLRWLRAQGQAVPAVMTLPARDCLYEGLVDKIFHAHWKYKEALLLQDQECFGLYGLPGYKLRAYFNAKVPAGYEIPESQSLDAMSREEVFKDEMIFKPYPYKDKSLANLSETIAMKEILVFPRYRDAFPFSVKNLSKTFYVSLISKLCDEFPDYTIRTMGTREGAWNITYDYSDPGVAKPNYINHVGKTPTFQALIDRFQVAIGTVGSQSFTPKLALLQGIKSFMIGHTRKRHQEEENWGNAECGFWEIGIRDYNKFYSWECIEEIVEFFKEAT